MRTVRNPAPEIRPDISGIKTPQFEVRKNFTVIEDTVTYKNLQEIVKSRRRSIFLLIVLSVCLVLGGISVVRYASIFQMTKDVRTINRENNKFSERLDYDEVTLATSNNRINLDEEAAIRGLVKSSLAQHVIINRESDVTLIRYLDEEEEPFTLLERFFFKRRNIPEIPDNYK